MPSTELDRLPAGASSAVLPFPEMMRRANVLAKSQLVPKAFQGKPESIMVVGVWGAEHGISLMTSLTEIHVIEDRPSPSAQLRLALIRAGGHEVRYVETSRTKAVIRGRRAENRDDPDGWVTVEFTVEDARAAHLLDRWVERWYKDGERNRLEKYVVGDDRGVTSDQAGAPDWVKKAIDHGQVKEKENWHRWTADMLCARAASRLSRLEFSDVMLAVGADPYTPEEHGVDVGHDGADPATGPEPEDDDITEAEVVEETPGSEPPLAPEQASSPIPPDCITDAAAPTPAPTQAEREEAARKERARAAASSAKDRLAQATPATTDV